MNNPLKAPPFWFLLATVGQFVIAWFSAVPPYSEFRLTLGYIMIGSGVVLALATWRWFKNGRRPSVRSPNRSISSRTGRL